MKQNPVDVGHREVCARITHEVAGVDGHGALFGKQLVEAGGQHPGVDGGRGGDVVGGDLVPPALPRDPIADLGAAIAGQCLGTEGGVQRTGSGPDVGADAELDRPVRAQCVGIVVDLHDGGGIADQRAVPGGPHVQRTAPRDHQIGAGDQLGGQRRRESARDAQPERIAAEQAFRHCRGGEQRARRAGESGEVALGVPGAAAGDEHRTLRPSEQAGEVLDVGRVGFGHGRGRDRVFGRRRPRRRLGLHVEPDVEHDGAPLAHRRRARAADVGVDGVGCVHTLAHRADRGDKRWLVDAEVRANRGPCGVGGKHDHRGAALGGLGDARHRIGEPAALVHRQHGGTAAEPGVRIGHRRGAALVPGGEIRDARGHQGVGHREVAAAHDAERVSDAQPGQRRADRLRNRLHGQLDGTNAKTRAGLPVPPTIGNGATTSTVPVAGS